MANSKPWIFVLNPFITATVNSYKLAVKISTYHLGALQSQAGVKFFDDLIDVFQPLHEALVAAFDSWKNIGGQQQGKTLNVAQLFSLLSKTKIRNWDIAIQNVYSIDTPEYKALLPHKRAPFQNGTQTDKLAAVNALSQAIGADETLATVKTDVDAFYAQLNTALTQQKGSLTSTKTQSDAVEAARMAMCIGQYADLGALIQHFAEMPEQIGQYFDLTAIRSGAQVVFTGDTKPEESENILKHTFADTDTLRLENEGETDLHFYLAPGKDAAPNGTTVVVPAGQEATVLVTQLGSVANTYLNVHNPSTLAKGNWTIELE